MSEEKQSRFSVVTDEPSPAPSPESAPVASPAEEKPAPVSWPTFLKTATDSEIKRRFTSECADILSKYSPKLSNYCVLVLLDPETSIGTYELDRIYSTLKRENPTNKKDVLLLLSRGGSIEPAYQISKLCKQHSKSHFVVAVPRKAKSAATLIAIGADEIHMGPLDNDARYHVALIHLTAGDIESTRVQLKKLRQSVPNYLLGIMLEHQIAARSGNQDSAAQAYKAFLSAYDAEIAAGGVGYQDHRDGIERFRKAAQASMAGKK